MEPPVKKVKIEVKLEDDDPMEDDVTDLQPELEPRDVETERVLSGREKKSAPSRRHLPTMLQDVKSDDFNGTSKALIKTVFNPDYIGRSGILTTEAPADLTIIKEGKFVRKVYEVNDMLLARLIRDRFAHCPDVRKALDDFPQMTDHSGGGGPCQICGSPATNHVEMSGWDYNEVTLRRVRARIDAAVLLLCNICLKRAIAYHELRHAFFNNLVIFARKVAHQRTEHPTMEKKALIAKVLREVTSNSPWENESSGLLKIWKKISNGRL